MTKVITLILLLFFITCKEPKLEPPLRRAYENIGIDEYLFVLIYLSTIITLGVFTRKD